MREILDKAIQFAASMHEGQYRKGTRIPYISHPYAVAMLLLSYGYRAELVIAGLLHDVLEDTSATYDEVVQLFGVQVAQLVDAASEPDKSLLWKERKDHTLETLKVAPMDVKVLVCADKLHNLRSILADLETIGEAVWGRFHSGVKHSGSEAQIWYYTGILHSLYANLPYERDMPIFSAYRKEVLMLRRWGKKVMDVESSFGGDEALHWIFHYIESAYRETGEIPSDLNADDLQAGLYVLSNVGIQEGEFNERLERALLGHIRKRTVRQIE